HVVCFLCRLFFSENNYTTKGTPPFLGAHTPEMIITLRQVHLAVTTVAGKKMVIRNKAAASAFARVGTTLA
ncbi:MAG: hypothetical protein OEY58_18325, partial [Gammaproteobacteria bacterium]|nr:hypothetical protein [Gammaproteobacteria bacterium]